MQVPRSFSFLKEIKPFLMAKVQLLDDLQEAAKEVNEHKKGNKKLKSAQELLNQL